MFMIRSPDIHVMLEFSGRSINLNENMSRLENARRCGLDEEILVLEYLLTRNSCKMVVT
jgi:hypothetical protein